jgi:hypothetical protein
MFNYPSRAWRFFRRAGWARPELYRRVGIWRRGIDCAELAYDVWIGGFPRSANTYAQQALLLANPSLRVRGHCHLPPEIIYALEQGKPGFMLVRNPEDAVASAALLWEGNLHRAADYYIDFHRVLRPYLPELMVVSFELVTASFDSVVRAFNRRYGADFGLMGQGFERVEQCFRRVEQAMFCDQGKVNELLVCRPSAERARIKPSLVGRLRSEPKLIQRMQEANQLYREFKAGCVEPALEPDIVHPSKPREVEGLSLKAKRGLQNEDGGVGNSGGAARVQDSLQAGL